MKPQPLKKAFDTAINDGINIYMRDIVRRSGFVSYENYAKLGEQDMLPLKYRIASQLAHQWAKATLPQLLGPAFDKAINDGINIYMREVVRALGFISEQNYARLGEQDMLQLKYGIASDLAQKWAKMPLILEDTEQSS